MQIMLGDGSGVTVFEHQPAKGAAIEGHWETNAPGQGASWAVLAWPDAREERNAWAIEIPYVLSLLATHDPTGQVKGLKDFPPDQRPPALPLLFYSFRVMVAIGFYFLFLAAWTGWVWMRARKGGGLRIDALHEQRWLLRAWIAAIPLGYIAVEAGWIVREVGRQPWIVYGLMRTEQGASDLSAATVGTSLAAYIVVYAVLLATYLVFAYRLLHRGPDLGLAPPERHPGDVLDTRPAGISERRRDVESA